MAKRTRPGAPALSLSDMYASIQSAYMHACIHTHAERIHACIHAHAHACIHAYAYACIYIFMHAYCAYRYACMGEYIVYVRKHTHTSTYASSYEAQLTISAHEAQLTEPQLREGFH